MKKIAITLLAGLATVSFADQTFSTDGGESPLPGTFSESYGGVLGSPYFFGPDFWEMEAHWGASAFDFRIGIGCDWRFNPSTDDWITSIDYDTDYRQYQSFRSPSLVLVQDGKTFYGSLPATSGQTQFWLHGSGNLVQDDFFELLPAVGSWNVNSHPNFGPGGSQIEFFVSFALYNSANLNSGSESFDYDNVNIHLNTVPEPVSFVGIAGGLAALALRRRKAA